MKVFSPFLNGDTTTSGSLNLPQHPTASAIINPNTGSIYHDTTDNVVKVYTGTQWQIVGEQTTPAPYVNTDIEYLLVAGGGGAGTLAGGGGGAGGLLSSSLASVTSGSSFTITIGGGGAGATVDGGNGVAGVNSSIAGATISTITATGGGLGEHNSAGGSGGSGGGGGYGAGVSPGGSGTVGQGNDGGAGSLGADSTTYPCGGGGGAGTAGSDAVSQGLGGDGGDGLQSSITGTGTFYAGGGGGSGGVTPGTGGQGGGGNGGQIFSGTTAQSGTSNTGGGGGGGRLPAGSGGSGVAIFAYDSGSFNCAGGIVGDAGNGRKYHQFNASDTFKVGSTSDFQIVTDSLMVHYDAGNFASRGASTWTDLQGNYNSTNNGATLGSNFYYDFNGSSHYMTNNIAYSSGGTYTFNWWMNADTTGTDVHMICEHDSDDSYMIHTGGGAGNLGIRIAKDASFAILDTTSAYTTGTWQYFSAVFSPSGHKLYRNGSLINSDSNTFNTPAATGHQIGRRLTGGANLYYNGRIGMIHIYSKELSSSEITQNYEATKTNFV